MCLGVTYKVCYFIVAVWWLQSNILVYILHKNTEHFIKCETTCLFFKDFITIWLVQHNVLMLYHLSLLHPMELFIIFVFSTYNFSISNEKTNCIHIQFELKPHKWFYVRFLKTPKLRTLAQSVHYKYPNVYLFMLISR